jgi:peroxiredoxin
MALTASTMLELGTPAQDFALMDVVSGKPISLATFANQPALLVMFICRHCPFVKHVQSELAALGRDFQNKGLGIVAISSNDVANYPEDAPEKLKDMANTLGFTFPFCYDATQEVAKAYTAACTPDFFLFDSDRHLVYRGQLDDSRPSNGLPVTGAPTRSPALAAISSGNSLNACRRKYERSRASDCLRATSRSPDLYPAAVLAIFAALPERNSPGDYAGVDRGGDSIYWAVTAGLGDRLSDYSR